MQNLHTTYEQNAYLLARSLPVPTAMHSAHDGIANITCLPSVEFGMMVLSEDERIDIQHVFNDGGREAAGFKGSTGDCVARSIAIVSGLPYVEVYDRLAAETGAQRASSRTRKKAASAANGINTDRKWFKDYMAELGFEWTPTMKIGQGCKVHLSAWELPMGRLIVCVSKHYTAVIDGICHDTYDPSRDGTRCVYGYWSKPSLGQKVDVLA